ncbi:DEAD/DEAH box helicase [Novosphingobium resinovorum]|uniref:DEAD/DEAH box helicase n=1 Tax=Novosphingobium resinovorum TaxID=158500 RepID=UPI002ED596A5|nr:AAA domain-containing protein [Novosphingobium resinovorum]
MTCIDSDPDTVRNALRSWIGVEILTPGIVEEGGWNGYAQVIGGQLRNRATEAQTGQSLWDTPEDDDIAPWFGEMQTDIAGGEEPIATTEQHPVSPGHHDAPQARREQLKPRPWYKIVLAAMPTAGAMKFLDGVFGDEVDDDTVDRKMRGNVLAATLILDEFGILVPGSIALACFAWGVGKLCADGAAADLSGWANDEPSLLHEVTARLSPTDTAGRPRALSWQDLRDVSRKLRTDLGVPEDLWIVTPCAIRTIKKDPPSGDILATFYLPDLLAVERDLSGLPAATRAYLGLDRPKQTWDALSDRRRLSDLLQPGLFPLARWPGPGLHPLTLLQQGAVNAALRDLSQEGLFAVNGPPGTGKTTLLRDVVAHVLTNRAERLAEIDKPWNGLGNIDLMDYAIVVASNNNAAVENISLELPLREKALDPSIWKDGRLTYFSHTATHVLGLSQDEEEARKAWGVMAAKLGNSSNRYEFHKRFWFDKDWGLSEWFDRVWSPNQPRFEGKEPSRLCQIDPPPTREQARAEWRKARAEFRDALEKCRRLRSDLIEMARARDRLRLLESGKPALHDKLCEAIHDREDAERALLVDEERYRSAEEERNAELGMLSALRSARPGFLARLIGSEKWRAYQRSIEMRVGDLERAGTVATEAARDRDATKDLVKTLAALQVELARQLGYLEKEISELDRKVAVVETRLEGASPEPGFWEQAEDALQAASPWNGGEFRAARDALFVAAVRLHRAFLIAGVKHIKPALNKVMSAGRGDPPTARDWGAFFLLVPVVSTTFASLGRMFPTLKGGSTGWFLLDEAGQACPQHALGAIWRARRAIVIGDPLQIPPVATLGKETTRKIFENCGSRATEWSAPGQSVQTLADRASAIQGQFPALDGNPEQPRITGFPLLVHRRCDNPMFAIANRIAYGERMIHATGGGNSRLREMLGHTAWIDVDAPSSDKWVAEEGRLIDQALRSVLRHDQDLPDLYIISPFRVPTGNLKALLTRKDAALGRISQKRAEAWLDRHVGTIHTFQGKEAECVILMLGAGRGAKNGSRKWAGNTPNMLNVAATRAKRGLYVVGNRELWRGAGVFATAAEMLPVVPADLWAEGRWMNLAQEQ